MPVPVRALPAVEASLLRFAYGTYSMHVAVRRARDGVRRQPVISAGAWAKHWLAWSALPVFVLLLVDAVGALVAAAGGWTWTSSPVLAVGAYAGATAIYACISIWRRSVWRFSRRYAGGLAGRPFTIRTLTALNGCSIDHEPSLRALHLRVINALAHLGPVPASTHLVAQWDDLVALWVHVDVHPRLKSWDSRG